MAARRRTVTERPAPNAGALPNPAPPEPETLRGPQGYFPPAPPPKSPVTLLEERVGQLERDLAALRELLAGLLELIDNAAGGVVEYLAARQQR